MKYKLCPGGSYSEILSGILGGIRWRAALDTQWAGSIGKLLWRDTRRDPLTSRSGGILSGIFSGEPLWRDTRGILGGMHGRAALAGYSAGFLVASRSGGILGGIHW